MRGDGLGMAASGLVVIWYDDYVSASKILVVLVAPLTRAHRVAGCDQAVRFGGVHILLALDDDGRVLVGNPLDELQQVIGHKLHAVEVPNPAALAVRPALAKAFWLVAHDLKSCLAVFVGVVVGLGDGAEPAATAVGWRWFFFASQRLDRTLEVTAVEKLD